MQERLDRETLAEQQANAAYLQDRRELQAHLDSAAAGSVFRLLDPSCCPRCDHEIDQARKKKEAASHSCSVCGENISSSEDAGALRKELEASVKASKAAIDKAQKNRGLADENLQKLQADLESIQSKNEVLTQQLGSFDARKLLPTKSQFSKVASKRRVLIMVTMTSWMTKLLCSKPLSAKRKHDQKLFATNF